ncbi:MAG: hypothetical protein AAF458_20685 [Pseudomonadota bacterium]
MPRPDPTDLSQVRTIELTSRSNKVDDASFAAPPVPGRSFSEFLRGLPQIDAALTFGRVVDAIVQARRGGRPVVWAMGAHVIKCGLNPVLIELMRRDIITAVAFNGAGAVHDFEVALIGETSEDVAAGLKDGSFGMVRETADGLNAALLPVMQPDRHDAGMGWLVGRYLHAESAPNRRVSLMAMAYELDLPLTVHVALGTDICHMHPSADGAAIGRATHNDFRILTSVLRDLSGGVYLNVGSSVLMPEVFLKAFTVAQNLGADLHDFTTVNMDMTNHYRPGQNVVGRPPQVGGAGYTLLGRHEFMVPLLAQAVVEQLGA